MRLLFPGSFDPFTIGHADLVERALAVADSIVIGIGVNSGKKSMFTVQDRLERIGAYYENEPRVEVHSYDGLTMDFMRETGADAILRGVRTVSDFESEKILADANLKIGGADTLLLISKPEFQYVSSSVVRELLSYGRSVDDMVISTFKSGLK